MNLPYSNLVHPVFLHNPQTFHSHCFIQFLCFFRYPSAFSIVISIFNLVHPEFFSTIHKLSIIFVLFSFCVFFRCSSAFSVVICIFFIRFMSVFSTIYVSSPSLQPFLPLSVFSLQSSLSPPSKFATCHLRFLHFLGFASLFPRYPFSISFISTICERGAQLSRRLCGGDNTSPLKTTAWEATKLEV